MEEEIKKIEKNEKKEESETKKLAKTVKSLQIVSWAALLMGIIAIIIAALSIMSISSTTQLAPTTVAPTTIPIGATNTSISLHSINVSGPLVVPPMSLPNAPIITQNQTFGSRLTNVNEPLNQSELAVINNASDSYFEKAGEMYLNGTINNVGIKPTSSPLLIVNGKPSVIYLGATSCLFCSENRWAMALALGRFGGFTNLFKGYSSFGDYDLPTLFWAPTDYYSNGSVDMGNFYSSKYINFISIDYASNLTKGFELPSSFAYFLQQASAANSTVYSSALTMIERLNNFQGTPYSIWGNFVVAGADAVDLGNTTPQSPPIPLTYMTHEDVLHLLANPNSQFAWREYAGADLYIAMTCATLKNAAPICALPAIQKIENVSGY
ncbi:MAG: DUF929 family protein [Candidatus Micrarchaeia archaeon]